MRAIKELWTPTSRLYDKADEGQPRRFVLDCGIAWQNYKDALQVWQPIDLTPELMPNGFRVRKVPYDLTILNTGERIIYPDRNSPAKRIRFPSSKFMAGKIFSRVSNSLLWESQGYDVQMVWENSRIKFNVIVKRSIPFDSVSFDVDKTGLSDSELMGFLTNLKAIDSTTPEPIIRALDVSLVAGVLTLGFDLTGMKFPVVIDPTLDLQVGASADDGFVAGTTFNSSGAFMDVGYYNAVCNAFYRFTGVSGLSGATINANTYISLWRGVYSANPGYTKISADDQVAPSAPTTTALYNAIVLTAAKVDWDGSLTYNVWNNSPSITTVIQELATSYDSSVIQVMHKDDSSPNLYRMSPATYDEGTGHAPKLHIEYTAGGGAALTKSLSDSVALADSISKGIGRSQSDSLTLTETIGKAPGLAESDSLAIADLFQKAVGFNRSPSDSLALVDSLSKGFGKVNADGLTLTDINSFSVGLSKTDTLALADSLAKLFGIAKTDSLALADTLQKAIGSNLSDTVTLTDFCSAVRLLLLSLADTLSISDVISKEPGLNKADSLSLADSLSKQVGINRAEVVTLVDAITNFLIGKALADRMMLREDLFRQVDYQRSMADDVSIADALSKALRTELSDSLTLADSERREVGKSLVDQVLLADVLARLVDFKKSLTENISISDSTFRDMGRLLAVRLLAYLVGLRLAMTASTGLIITPKIGTEYNITVKPATQYQIAVKMGVL